MKTHHAIAIGAALGALLAATILLPACQSRRQRFQSRMQSAPTPAEIIEQRDDDGDGKLTLEEFADGARGDPEQTFARADANTDGYLDADELQKLIDAIRNRAGG